MSSARIMELLPPGGRISGVKACLRMSGWWHLPKEVKSQNVGNRVRRSAKPRAPGEPLEREVKAGIKLALEADGWIVLDFEQDYRPTKCKHCGGELGKGSGTRVPLGTPDLYVAGFGFTFWIEVKREGGALSRHQADLHGKLTEAGDSVYILRSPDSAVLLSAELRTGSGIYPPQGEYPPREQ